MGGRQSITPLCQGGCICMCIHVCAGCMCRATGQAIYVWQEWARG